MTEDTKLQNRIKATLRCVTAPTVEQEAKFRAFLAKKYHADSPDAVDLAIRRDPSIEGGFILEALSEEYDWSVRGRAEQVTGHIRSRLEKAGKDADLISILGCVDDYTIHAEAHEVGHVETVGDGIVTIRGLDHVMYGEILVFENGVRGMVQNITTDGIGAILFDEEGTIGEGSRVTGTGRRAGVPVGEMYLGRVVNALGAPIDGGPEITSESYRPIEMPAPGIIDRQPVTKPLETGILSIDSMFPVGRGQRELIIGDRQTGKTSIALDTILNQQGKDCICVYVAIGQKASTVASLVETLRRHGAMAYTIVVVSTASDPAPLQYIAPYAATSIAEYFMYSGRDALIVYDDLSKHAVAYRTLSLLLGRAPGREAYPGDVFYLHSRLLERSSHLSDALGGGSLTALPVIETQDGDVSAYIPTNVISITDGQIFLESDLFFEGQRPAVNVGLSVSRVGGAAQTKAMKKAAGSLRIDLAQYREMEVFMQFSSDLDDATKQQLAQGRAEMELLKQPLGHPFSMAEEVAILVAAQERKFSSLPVKEIRDFRGAFLTHLSDTHADLMNRIAASGKLEDADREEILTAADETLAGWKQS